MTDYTQLQGRFHDGWAIPGAACFALDKTVGNQSSYFCFDVPNLPPPYFAAIKQAISTTITEFQADAVKQPAKKKGKKPEPTVVSLTCIACSSGQYFVSLIGNSKIYRISKEITSLIEPRDLLHPIERARILRIIANQPKTERVDALLFDAFKIIRSSPPQSMRSEQPKVQLTPQSMDSEQLEAQLTSALAELNKKPSSQTAIDYLHQYAPTRVIAKPFGNAESGFQLMGYEQLFAEIDKATLPGSPPTPQAILYIMTYARLGGYGGPKLCHAIDSRPFPLINRTPDCCEGVIDSEEFFLLATDPVVGKGGIEVTTEIFSDLLCNKKPEAMLRALAKLMQVVQFHEESFKHEASRVTIPLDSSNGLMKVVNPRALHRSLSGTHDKIVLILSGNHNLVAGVLDGSSSLTSLIQNNFKSRFEKNLITESSKLELSAPVFVATNPKPIPRDETIFPETPSPSAIPSTSKAAAKAPSELFHRYLAHYRRELRKLKEPLDSLIQLQREQSEPYGETIEDNGKREDINCLLTSLLYPRDGRGGLIAAYYELTRKLETYQSPEEIQQSVLQFKETWFSQIESTHGAIRFWLDDRNPIVQALLFITGILASIACAVTFGHAAHDPILKEFFFSGKKQTGTSYALADLKDQTGGLGDSTVPGKDDGPPPRGYGRW
jgi:hypothetical protein